MRERKKGQRAPKGTARRPQEHPTGAPEGPTGAQEAPKSTQNDPERTPRWLQEPPKAAQYSPDHVDVNRRPQIVKVDKTLSLWGPGGRRMVPVGRGISTPLIGGRFFVRCIAYYDTVFYLAGLGDRILKASPLPPAPS